MLANAVNTRSPEFVEYSENAYRDTSLKTIAFYLPQFHPIPQNDQMWGRGFTEWSNVTKAVPQYVGHYQPHLPIDNGYYDLRIVDNIRRQAELARNYGVYGFAFHHYWFAGRQVLRTPIELLMSDPSIDINFCISWANENWTKRWDGREEDVIFRQHHSDKDDLAYIKDAARYLMDPRYIRVNGAAVLGVYRPQLLPNPARTAQLWRDYCSQAGVGDLCLLLIHSLDAQDPREFGFDAAIEFPHGGTPHREGIAAMRDVEWLNPAFDGSVFSYESLVKAARTYSAPPYDKFRGVCAGWDNDARMPGRSHILHGATPSLYRVWLEQSLQWTRQHMSPDRQFVFINAWNEWAEGAHLEPDRRFGYGYLQATHDAVASIGSNPTVGSARPT